MIKHFEITIKTKKRFDFVKITEKIEEIIKDFKDGIAILYLPHNTCALIIQENDPTIFKDIENFFNKILPLNAKYEHNYEGSENATAHIINNLISKTLAIPFKDGKLQLGTWQDIFVVELFEPRERKVYISIIC